MNFPEYELAGIETIARGICVQMGRVLLCRAKGGHSTYLPGGHIEFGEKGREALVREMREEMNVAATAGALVGVVENQLGMYWGQAGTVMIGAVLIGLYYFFGNWKAKAIRFSAPTAESEEAPAETEQAE